MASTSAVGDEQPNKRQQFSGTNDNGDSSAEVPIQAVYIHGVEPNMIDEIRSHFGQFGEIESVAMRFEDSQTHWCHVQFKCEGDAAEALLRSGNKWNRCDVKAADPWHQPDHPLQVAPEQDSDSNISVALNDDCLHEIFKRLKPSCLTNVAGVCKRFNAQAKITFASKHKHLDLAEQFYRQHDLFEAAMKHFGKDIQSLIIDAFLFLKEADAYRWIGQYCGPKLKQLELRNFLFLTDLLLLRPTFAQIERLQLHKCIASISFTKLMAACVELKSLVLSSCYDQHTLSSSFPKLQELSFYHNLLGDEDVENFVTRHPALIKLSMEDVQLSPRLLSTVGQHAKQLQELKFVQVQDENVQFQKHAAHIGQLSSLKNLHLDIKYSIVPLLNALVAGEVPIENMNVRFTEHLNFDQVIKCISQLKQIEVLQLGFHIDSDSVGDEDVVELAKSLPELEELHLEEIHRHVFWANRPNYEFKSQLSTIGLRKMLMHANKLKMLKLHSIDSIKIDMDDYNAMLRMVQKRKEKVPLVIEIHGQADQVNVPAPFLAENRSTFNIKLIR